MHPTQRGSVLIAVIAGIVILSLLGAAMLSMMTSSTMTGVNGRETIQASYLADSGKEIARDRTADKNSGELMTAARDLESLTASGGMAVGSTGSVTFKLYPSWFRWYDNALQTTDSGWYKDTQSTSAPTGQRVWLAVRQTGAMLYKGRAGATDFGTTAADIYLVGQADGTATYDAATRTLSVPTATDDFSWFPESGGLIGLVTRAGQNAAFPLSATVSTVRFTYDQRRLTDTTCTFTNLTPLTDDTVSQSTFTGKDIALGQYFRVVSEGTTANGARAALIWHTNGRNSLKVAGQSGQNVAVNTNGALSSTSDQALHKEMQDLFGNNITNHSNGANSGYDSTYISSSIGYALTTDTLKASVKNHFLLPLNGNKSSTDYWFGAVSKAKTTFTADTDTSGGGVVQVSVVPPSGTQALFAGILFRLKTLKNDDSSATSNAYTIGDGVAGLGMGVAWGQVTVGNITGKVYSSSINPALLPGFTWYANSGRYYTNDNFSDYASLYSATLNIFTITYDFGPIMILWAYDDSAANPPDSLRWLAVSSLDKVSMTSNFSRLVAQVQEKNGTNQIRAWFKQDTPANGVVWPDMNPDDAEANDGFTLLHWDAVNSPYASRKSETFHGKPGYFTVSTPYATGTTAYQRTGFFQGVYSADSTTPYNPGPAFRNFAAGSVTTASTADTAGLTPGFIQ